jgi:hypothetical protein
MNKIDNAIIHFHKALNELKIASNLITKISEDNLSKYEHKKRVYRIKVARTHIDKNIDICDNLRRLELEGKLKWI